MIFKVGDKVASRTNSSDTIYRVTDLLPPRHLEIECVGRSGLGVRFRVLAEDLKSVPNFQPGDIVFNNGATILYRVVSVAPPGDYLDAYEENDPLRLLICMPTRNLVLASRDLTWAPRLAPFASPDVPAWKRDGGEFPGFCDPCGGHRRHRIGCPAAKVTAAL